MQHLNKIDNYQGYASLINLGETKKQTFKVESYVKQKICSRLC